MSDEETTVHTMKRENHYWHTCSDCGHDYSEPSSGPTCPLCDSPPACAVGEECVEDYKYERGGPDEP